MLEVGYAETEITPAPGSLMACFPRGEARAPRRARGALDALMVRALALECDDLTLVVCTGDVTMWKNENIAAVRRLVRERRGDLPPEHIVLAATHTHSGPENSFMFGNTPDDPWIADLYRKTAETILKALDDVQPARLRAGQVDAPFNHNRRVPGSSRMAHEHEPGVTVGPTDPTLTVLELGRERGDSILWTNWTAHALTLGPPNDYFSADYPGALAREVERQDPSAHLLFTNGAAGNVHPRRCMRDDYEITETLGRDLAAKVAEVRRTAEEVQPESCRFSTRQLQFPNRLDSTVQAPVEVSALQLGSVASAFVPGEFYVEFQLAWRQKAGPQPAFLVGYANGWCGYIPTASAYEEGGYGVDLYRGDEIDSSRTMLPPGAGERIADTLMHLVS